MPQQLEFDAAQPHSTQANEEKHHIWQEKLRSHLQDPTLRQVNQGSLMPRR